MCIMRAVQTPICDLAVTLCLAVSKRIYGALDKKLKVLVMGKYNISLTDLLHFYLDRRHGSDGVMGLGLRLIDLLTPRPNKMDTTPFFRFIRPEVRAALLRHPEYNAHYKGLAVFADWAAAFSSLFTGDSTTPIKDLVECGGFVIGFMRIWHSWLEDEQGRTKDFDAHSRLSVLMNGLPIQTRIDIEIAVASLLTTELWCRLNSMCPLDRKRMVGVMPVLLCSSISHIIRHSFMLS
jgi:hypothetical protein